MCIVVLGSLLFYISEFMKYKCRCAETLTVLSS